MNNYVNSTPQVVNDDNLPYTVSYETDESGRQVEIRKYKPGQAPSEIL